MKNVDNLSQIHKFFKKNSFSEKIAKLKKIVHNFF
jgi:hypothetical protein